MEVEEGSDRREANHVVVEDPTEDVEVVATLLDDHRRRLGGDSPVSPHEAVRHVPGGDILSMIARDDIAETARPNNVANRLEERRRAQHMTDCGDDA